MRPLRAPAVLLALALGCGASPPRTAAPAPPPPTPSPPSSPASRAPPPAIELPEGLEALVASLDELPFPGVGGRALVRVHTGRPDFRARGPDRGDEQRIGLLVREEPDSFTVVHALAPVTYRLGQSFGGHDVGHEPVGWDEVLERALASARARVSGAEPNERSYRVHHDRPSERLRAVLLARAALANGHERPARELLSLAARMDGPSMPLDAPDDPVAAIRGDLALHLLTLAASEYGREELDRPALLDRLQRIVERYDGTEAAAVARSMLPVLTRMIEEDRAGPPDGRLDRLVFQLRDATYGGARRDLSQLGAEATPALIAIMDDERFTRMVHVMGRLPRFETYGHVARSLLHGISGERFDTPDEARAWWREVQQVGEAELLARQVRAGGYRAVSALRRLLEVDPRRGVREGTRAAREADERLQAMFVSTLARAGEEVPTRFFLDYVRRDGPLGTRIHAAQALQARGVDGWVDPMVEVLRARLQDEGEDEREPRDEGRAPRRPRRRNPMEDLAMRQLLDLLVQHGGEAGIEALAELQPRLGAEDRLALLTSATRVSTSDPEAQARVNALLVQALDDDSPAIVRFAYGALAECIGSVGDVAAVYLSQRLNGGFTCAMSPDARARARAELANAWRVQRGEPTGPVPPAPRPASVDAGELDAAVLALRTAEGGEAIRSALARFESLGPAAAPRLAELAGELPPGHPAQAPAEATARRLASRVVSVDVDDADAPLARAPLEALEGRALDESALPRLFAALVTESPTGRVTVFVHRDGQGHGVRLRVVSSVATERHYGAWTELVHAVRRDAEMLGRDWSHLEPLDALGMRGYRGLARHLEAILDAPPGVDGEALVQLRWSR